MGSTRLPGKVLQPLAGRPMLARIADRVGSARSVDKVLVATTVLARDDVIAELCSTEGLDCFRGSESDVLNRFRQAAHSRGARAVLRITADCPCADPDLIDAIYTLFERDDLDHASVSTGAGAALSKEFRWPDGLDAEWMKFTALDQAEREATAAMDREHVTPYIWRNRNLFKIGSLPAPEDGSQLRLTVDNEADFELISRIYDHFAPNGLFRLADIIALLREHPELVSMNQAYIGTEGYQQFHQDVPDD